MKRLEGLSGKEEMWRQEEWSERCACAHGLNMAIAAAAGEQLGDAEYRYVEAWGPH